GSHVRDGLPGSEGLVRPADRALRAAEPRSRRGGPPLRAGRVRRAQGLSRSRRPGPALPAAEARRAAQPLCAADVHPAARPEVGTMNIMLKIGDEVITPPLSQGTILPGVTRDSALTLMREWGLRVSERQVAIDEVARAARDGSLREVWGTGTAAVISPVGELT